MAVTSLAIVVAIAAALIPLGAPRPRVITNCGPPLQGWATSRDQSRIVNTLTLHPSIGGTLPATWNGTPVQPEHVREYLNLFPSMRKPAPTLLLVVSPQADCSQVQMYRKMVEDVLDCGGGQCVEVSP